jgi:amino acid adenylation domain-containing protein
MKTIKTFLSELNNLNIKLWVEGEQLRYRAPPETLTPSLRAELVARKAEVITFLSKAQQHSEDVLPPIVPISRNENLRLSFAQQRLWFLEQLEGESTVYNLPAALRLEGGLHHIALEKSLQTIIQRHEILRTTFITVNEQPVSVIHSLPITHCLLPIIDLKGLLHDKQHTEIQRLINEDAQYLFDLSQGPLFRTTLLQLDKQRHVLLVNMHHIISDGWSLGIFIRELSTLYEAFSTGKSSPLSPLPIQYVDFAHWQRQWLAGERFEKQLSYWKTQLKDTPALLELPTDHPRPPVQHFRGNTESLILTPELTAQLKALSQQTGTTLFMVLFAVFATLLSRYSGLSDIVIGSPIANRIRSQIEPLIGFFVNTLVLRLDLKDNPSFDKFLKQVRQVTLEAYAHQDIPFEKLVEALQPERSLSHTPLFQVTFILQNTPLKTLELPEITLTPLVQEDRTAKFDLTLAMEETNDGLEGFFEYNTDLFENATIKRMVGHFQTLLDGIVANPQQSIHELPLLTKAEYQQLMAWNDTATDYPQDKCIHQLFEEQVEKTPEAIAVVFQDQSLTYRALNKKANQLAHYLQTLGVKPEILVGICVERSLEMVIGLLGILKAGGAYVPLDPNYPQERLAFMLADSQVRVLLTQSSIKLPSNQKPQILYLDTDWHTILQQNHDNLNSGVISSNLAYVIYTSGSTGKPKGVLIPHQGLLNLVFWHKSTFKVTDKDKATQLANIAFDASVWELWPYLASGSSIYLIEVETLNSTSLLRDWLVSKQITISFLPTPLAEKLLFLQWPSSYFALRMMLTGGDKLHQYPPTNLPFQVVNNYGPTENTVVTTFGEIISYKRENKLPYIGKVIANTKIYILNHHLKLVPIGIPGELYISGASLARGYLNCSELTAEKFIPNPFSDDSNVRLYKTGDLVCYLPDRNIEYLGRLDNQVKIRGFRIELGEIETVLAQHPAVQKNVVIVHKKSSNDRYLVAYWVTNQRHLIDNIELRHFLQEKLPDYMIPQAFVLLEIMPLTPNGKIDRQALSQLSVNHYSLGKHVAPRTPEEEILAGIWTNILEIEQVGIFDNFFELGGHSLLATQVVSRIRSTFFCELPLRHLFEFPTVAELCQQIELANRDKNLLVPPIKPITRQGDMPLSFAQERLWFLEQLVPNNPFYNIPIAVRFKGQINLTILKQSLFEIIKRHETLRTTFQIKNGVPIQVIHPVAIFNYQLSIINLQALPSEEQSFEVKTLLNEEAQRPFDLKSGPLFRITVLQLQAEENILAVTTPHIINDGWSLGIFVQELSSIYEAFLADKSHSLPELPLQYADFSYWQRQWLSGTVLETQLNYWQQQLADTPSVLEIPSDKPRPPVHTFQGASEAFELTPELTRQLKSLSQQTNVTLFMTSLAAFAILLERYSAQENIVIGSPMANRTHQEIEPLIGLFVNTLVLRIDLSGNPSFTDLLKRVRKVTLEAYAHQDLPFEQLVEALQPERDMSRNPLVQVALAFQNVPMPPLELPGLTLNSVEFENKTVRFDLEFYLWEESGQLMGNLDYYKDVFESATIKRLLGHFQTLLASIATHPKQSISEVELLSEAERHQLLVEWNNTEADYPQDKCIHQLFEEQVEIAPEAIAVVFENHQMTYRELNSKANQLAHYLQTLGVKPEVLVGICIERSLEMIIGLLGILKTGGAYVPLDPGYPQERLAFMLEDSQVRVLLTQSSIKGKLPSNQKVQVIYLDTDRHTLLQQSHDNPNTDVMSSNLAYVIYTSGSTGQPKGVAIEHRSTMVFLNWAKEIFTLQELSRVLASTSICFDLSVFELFVPLSWGGSLVLVENALHLPTLSKNIHVTLVNTVPSAIAELARVDGIPSSVQIINLAGEALKKELVQQIYQRETVQKIFNLYGPSEDTTYSTFALMEKGNTKSPTIGCPIANTQTYILDQNLQPVSIGVPGELYMGGMGLARGYLNHPELTAEKFIPNPFSNDCNARLYKTGDLARYLTKGNIDYLGRSDNQVKIRGFRIELGEIESTLAQHAQIREAVVIAQDAPSSKRLVAYVVLSQGQDTSLIDELRHFIKGKLPDYMMPSAFVILDALPLTPNGKVNRRALPAPDDSFLSHENDVMPQTEMEQIIASVWQGVLHIEKISLHSNFFDLGGHSLLLAQVQAKLQERLDESISILELFQYPTIHALAQHFNPKQTAKQFNQQTENHRILHQASNDIAIIGMSCRFPGAPDVETFWQNLQNGVESITFFTDEILVSSGVDSVTLNNPNYVKAGAIVSDIEQFDAAFFGVSAREAVIMDPQHRLFLMCAVEALENAGYSSSETDEKPIGVYAGIGSNSYFSNNIEVNRNALKSIDNFQVIIGNDKDFLSTRVSYKLNLTGPSINVQTACSTSLVAVHLARQGLLTGDCDIALAGGVSIGVPQQTGYLYQQDMILSPDGHCRAFDAKAQGTITGDGVGIVVLKKLTDAIADGDCIHAVIKSSAINNDGSLKIGYTAPSVEGQAAVISRAQTIANIEADSITYMEAHGTGTVLGDPIEIAALKQAFQATTQKKVFCAIGSVKTNIGHADTASGIAGLIKTVLALKHQQLLPSLHFEQPNPQIDFANSPFYVNAKLTAWETDKTPRRAGVSSFGIGGTNAHVILEEAPSLALSGNSRSWQLLTLSAKTLSALETMTANLASHLEQHPEINFADVAYTLSKGRKAFNYRRMLVCHKVDEATTTLQNLESSRVVTHFQEQEDRPIIFMFSGQGTQYVNMGLELYQTEPTFQKEVDQCSEYLKSHLGFDLRQVLYPDLEIPPFSKEGNLPSEGQYLEVTPQQLNQIAIAQVALFVIEYALAQLWMSWGIYPQAMIGHSIGEYVAACLAEVFSLEEALSLVAARGQMMQQLPRGMMLALSLSELEVQPFLTKGISLAAVNGPSRCVVSGLTEMVEALQNRLSKQGVECRRLQTSHAFHSEMTIPILTTFTERVKQVELKPPKIPYVSNVTGNWITREETTDPNYWAKHLRQTVRFADGLQQLLKNSAHILLEIGPGRTLSTLVKQHPDKMTEQTVLTSLRHPQDHRSDVAFLLNSLGKLWLLGGKVDWSGFYAHQHRYRLPLPTYPFECQRYWIDPPHLGSQTTEQQALPEIAKLKENDNDLVPLHSRPTLLKAYVAPRNTLEQTIADIWAKSLGIEKVGIDDNFFELGGDSLLSVQIVPQLREAFNIKLALYNMIEAPTVALLAAMIEEVRIFQQKEHSVLVEIQSGENSTSIPPIFCIHPAGGTVFSYVKLAHYLEFEQAVYGIQSPSLAGEIEPVGIINKAAYYIEIIKKVQAQGPYLLVGQSYGGNMAVEMARQLHGQGDKVALVALLDSYPPLSYEHQVKDNTSFLKAFLSATDVLLGNQYALRDLWHDGLKQLSEDEQWNYLIEHIDDVLLDEAPEDILKAFKIWQTHHRELGQHTQQNYPGHITLFQASEELPNQLDIQLGMNVQEQILVEGWNKLSSQLIEVIKVPGSHFSLIEEPHVQILAQQLKNVIQKVLSPSTKTKNYKDCI